MQNLLFVICKQSQPITNLNHVWIALIVCATVTILAIVVCAKLHKWKKLQFEQEKVQKEMERTWEKEDVQRKQIAEYREKVLALLKDDNQKIEKLEEYLKDFNKQ